MKKYQETVYKLILFFSVLINLFLVGLLFFVVRDSVSETGAYFFEGQRFWYFVEIITTYTLLNFYFLFNILKKSAKHQPEKSIRE
ncbi:hypothetical protein [Chryseobacterium sp. SC28]|uniref:hypothetical protein n=1 Tax=Chryseobacterium sp. SC28 TaxID=2268028 RepID=UPI000F649035|nr:hypothetical protein [Chryseobacterium sp. SC28]RRQ45929.1 hypothetical protein DTW91_07550 [Chryseobacterium sp. SC28]